MVCPREHILLQDFVHVEQHRVALGIQQQDDSGIWETRWPWRHVHSEHCALVLLHPAGEEFSQSLKPEEIQSVLDCTQCASILPRNRLQRQLRVGSWIRGCGNLGSRNARDSQSCKLITIIAESSSASSSASRSNTSTTTMRTSPNSCSILQPLSMQLLHKSQTFCRSQGGANLDITTTCSNSKSSSSSQAPVWCKYQLVYRHCCNTKTRALQAFSNLSPSLHPNPKHPFLPQACCFCFL